jgi:hypothetical protein
MGQFSMKISAPTGSILGGNQHMFLLMMRLAGSATEYYSLPPGRVV